MHLKTLGRHDALDRKLAAGAQADAGSALALRADELVRQRSRRALASELVELVAAVEAPEPPRSIFTRPVALNNRAVLEARALLLQLADRLRDPAPVNARGVAIVRKLLRDGGSPLYRPSLIFVESEPARFELLEETREAIAGLDLGS